jgi:transposase
VIQITPQMRVLVAVEPADFRCGIDGLAQRCRAVLRLDPMTGAVILFRNRTRKSIKLLVYDGQGFWLCQKRLSSGKFGFWPSSADGVVRELLAHELQVLIFGGDPTKAGGAPMWRAVGGPRAIDPGACVP